MPIFVDMKERKLIFVTNDDGYAAKGFACAVEMARRMGDVIAVAPALPQSGKSQAITIYEPLFLRERAAEDGLKVYSLTGTPVDCVKFAFDHLLGGRRPDLVISGINHGSNSAVNVLYSGTMGAAIEGAFYGCPSMGLSLTSHDEDADFTAAVLYGERIARALLDMHCEGPLCLNVNVPDIPAEEIAGVKICRQTRGFWREVFSEHLDPHGRRYFWMKGDFMNAEPDNGQTDEHALAHGYVSVVPVQTDMTDYAQMNPLRSALAGVDDGIGGENGVENGVENACDTAGGHNV